MTFNKWRTLGDSTIRTFQSHLTYLWRKCLELSWDFAVCFHSLLAFCGSILCYQWAFSSTFDISDFINISISFLVVNSRGNVSSWDLTRSLRHSVVGFMLSIWCIFSTYRQLFDTFRQDLSEAKPYFWSKRRKNVRRWNKFGLNDSRWYAWYFKTELILYNQNAISKGNELS